MVTRWIQTKLRSPDRVERHFAYLILGVVIMCISFIYACPGTTPLGATWLCTCWTLAIVFFVLLMTHLEQHAETKWVEWCRLALFLLLALAVLIFFDASNIVNRYRYKSLGPSFLYDEMFITMDESLFGWIFPRGQITLFLDRNEMIGVTSTFGILAAEVLQVLYTSYYLWGNGLGVWLAIQYFWFTVYQQKTGMERKRLQWRRLQMFLTAWLGTFLFNFVLNLTFPAVSPRIYLINEYQNEIQGLFLANLLRRALKAAAANSFSVFPSGHCGLSWLAAYMAHRMGYQQYHVISAAAACLITTATLVLRYHYVVDMVFAWPLLVFGIYFGGFHSEDVYQQSLEFFPSAKHDDDLGATYPRQSPPANLDHELVPLKSIARD